MANTIMQLPNTPIRQPVMVGGPNAPQTQAPRGIESSFVVPHDQFTQGATPAAAPAAPPATPEAHLQYFGGGILTHPDVVPVYLGNYFKTKAGQGDVKHNDAAMKDMVHNKDFTSIWAQYGVGKGTSEQSHIIGGNYKAGQPITDKEIRAMLQKQVDSGAFDPTAVHVVKSGDTVWGIAEQLQKDGVSKNTVPQVVSELEKMNPEIKNPNLIYPGQKITVPAKRNPQAVYTVVLPPGAVLTTDDGTNSLEGLGGYHGNITDKEGRPVYYAAIAYSKGNNGIDFTNGNAQDNISITESHEVSEAATDPNVDAAIAHNSNQYLGWYDQNNGEIGDIEVNDAPPGTPLNTMFGREDGYALQKIWSNTDGTNETKAVHPGKVQPLPKPVS